MNLGFTEILLILGVALLFFGPSRLPGLGKALGDSIRNFKKGLNDTTVDGDSAARREQIVEAQDVNSEAVKKSEKEKV